LFNIRYVLMPIIQEVGLPVSDLETKLCRMYFYFCMYYV
jgi:hypothetical protein